MNRRRFLALAIAAAWAPDALARSLGGTPLALVTADLEGKVVALELGTGRLVREIATLPYPRSIESVGTVAVVAHTEEGALSLIDTLTLRVHEVIRGLGEPRYTAAGLEGRLAYVTDSARGELVVLDVARGRIASRLALDGPARHLSLDPWARILWTALGTRAAEVAVVDLRRPEHPRLAARIRPPFLAHDVGFAPGGQRVWVTSGEARELALYNAWSREPVLSLPAGAPPQHVTFLGGRAFVTSGDDGTLRVHDAGSGRMLGGTEIPIGSYNVQEGWGQVLTPSLSLGTLCVVDRRGRLVQRVRAARSSHDACFVMSV